MVICESPTIPKGILHPNSAIRHIIPIKGEFFQLLPLGQICISIFLLTETASVNECEIQKLFYGFGCFIIGYYIII